MSEQHLITGPRSAGIPGSRNAALSGSHDRAVLVLRNLQTNPPPALHYVISLDVSASMVKETNGRSRFQIARFIFQNLIQSLRECDSVTVFLFNHVVTQLYHRQNPRECVLRETELTGMTNLELLFLEIAKCVGEAENEEWVDIVLTDGMPTCGAIRESHKLASFRAELYAKRKPRVGWFAAIGHDAQWELARDIASATKTSWTHIPDGSEAVFAAEMKLLQKLLFASQHVKVGNEEYLCIGKQRNYFYVGKLSLQTPTQTSSQTPTPTISCPAFVELLEIWEHAERADDLEQAIVRTIELAPTWNSENLIFRKDFEMLQQSLLRKMRALQISSASFHADACLDIQRTMTMQL